MLPYYRGDKVEPQYGAESWSIGAREEREHRVTSIKTRDPLVE